MRIDMLQRGYNLSDQTDPEEELDKTAEGETDDLLDGDKDEKEEEDEEDEKSEEGDI